MLTTWPAEIHSAVACSVPVTVLELRYCPLVDIVEKIAWEPPIPNLQQIQVSMQRLSINSCSTVHVCQYDVALVRD